MISSGIYHFYIKLSTEPKNTILLNCLVSDDGNYLLSSEAISSKYGIDLDEIKLLESILDGTFTSTVYDGTNIDGYTSLRLSDIADQHKNNNFSKFFSRLQQSNKILKKSYAMETRLKEIDASQFVETITSFSDKLTLPAIMIRGKMIYAELVKTMNGIELTLSPKLLTEKDKDILDYLETYLLKLVGFINFAVDKHEIRKVMYSVPKIVLHNGNHILFENEEAYKKWKIANELQKPSEFFVKFEDKGWVSPSNEPQSFDPADYRCDTPYLIDIVSIQN